jgi:hypothetical protein
MTLGRMIFHSLSLSLAKYLLDKVRVYAKHYVRQRQNNLTTFFNFNEREIIRPNDS